MNPLFTFIYKFLLKEKKWKENLVHNMKYIGHGIYVNIQNVLEYEYQHKVIVVPYINSMICVYFPAIEVFL